MDFLFVNVCGRQADTIGKECKCIFPGSDPTAPSDGSRHLLYVLQQSMTQLGFENEGMPWVSVRTCRVKITALNFGEK